MHNKFKTYRFTNFHNTIMDYNTNRSKLMIPEYGRNIQKMIDYTVTIEDMEERNRAARALIGIMSRIKPNITESNDYQRTLWDHMYIISKFKLVVDSPYPPPSQEELAKKPEKIPYSTNQIKYRHYGKNIEGIIQKAVAYEEGAEKDALTHMIANHLKKSYLNWNRDSVADETILKQLSKLSDGDLAVNEDTKLIATSEVLSKNKQKKRKHSTKGKDHRGGRKNYRSY